MHDRFFAEHIATMSPIFQHCKGVDCQHILQLRVEREEAEEGGQLPCSCGFVMCWSCGQVSHAPCSCVEYREWEKLSNEDKAMERLKSQCKDCPKCHNGVLISEKNACNHMTCTCGHEWCWMCYGDWSKHGGDYYACRFYKDRKDLQEEEKKKAMGLADAERVSQFEDLIAPLAAASTPGGTAYTYLFDNIAKLRKNLEESLGETENKTEFLLEAANVVVRTKKMLKWSFVYLYFTPDGSNPIYEQQRAICSHSCDVLHIMLCPDKKNNPTEYDIQAEILGNETTVQETARVAARRKRNRDAIKFESSVPHKPTFGGGGEKAKYSAAEIASERRAKFQDFKVKIMDRYKQLDKYKSAISQYAMKAMRDSNSVDSGLITWRYRPKGGSIWTQFEYKAAKVLEMKYRSPPKTLDLGSDMSVQLAENTYRKRDGETGDIERVVHASKASCKGGWECGSCGANVPGIHNACIGCGKVKGHS